MAEIDDENIVNEDNQYSRVDDTTTEPPFRFNLDQYLSDLKPDPVPEGSSYPEVKVTPNDGLSPYMRTYLNNVQSGAKKAMSNADFSYLGGYFDQRYEAALRAVDQNIQELNISEQDKANIYKDQNTMDLYVKIYNRFRDSGGDINNFDLFAENYDPVVGDPKVIEHYTDPKLKQKFDERLKKKYTDKNYLTYNKASVNNLPDKLDVNTLNNHFKDTDIYFDMDNGELRANYGDQSTKELQAAPGGFFQGAVEFFTGKESLGMNSLVVDPYNPIQLSKWIQNTLLTAEEEKKISVSNTEEKKNNYYKLQLSRPEKFQSSQINTKAIENYVVKQKKQVVSLAKSLESDKNEFDKLQGTETIIKYNNLEKEYTELNDKLTEIKKNLEGKTNPSEKDINDYNLQVENLSKIYQSIEEIQKTDEFSYYSELNKSLVKNSEELVKLNENAKTIEEQNKVVIAKQYIEKEKTGSFVGNIASGIYTGLLEKAETGVILAFDAAVGTGLVKVDDLFGPSYAVDLGKSDTQKYNEFKRELSNVFDNEITNRFTEAVYGTTEEYAQSDKRSDLEKSARMVSEAIGIITGGGGNAPLTLFGFFSQSYNAINKEMRGEEFDDLTSFEKNILAVPVSIAVGYLDKLGAKVSLGDPLMKNLLLKTLAKSIKEIPKDATLEYVESAIKKNISTQIALGTLKIVGSSLAEGFTEGAQEVVTMSAKAIFNEYHKKDLFNLPDITTKEGREEAKNIVLENIYYGTIGGTIMSSGEQAVSAVKNGFDNSKADAKFDLLYNTITDPELILTVKNAIKIDLANQKITRETAEQRMESVNSVYSLFQSIPKDLSTGQKKEAFNLINEKKRLEQEIEGKDPSLVDAQKKRVSEINESLKTISNNAAKETTNKQQAVTAEGGGSEYQGTSEGQPEVGQVEGGQREATVNETDIGNSTIPSKVQEEVTELGQKQLTKGFNSLSEATKPEQVANAIVNIEQNKNQGALLSKEQEQTLSEAKAKLKEQGHEIVDYNIVRSGENTIVQGVDFYDNQKDVLTEEQANAIESRINSLEKRGEEVNVDDLPSPVSRTIKPLIKKDGKMVQAAEVNTLRFESVEQAKEAIIKSREVANKTTDENYDISQEVNNNIAKENPDASVLLTPKGNDLSLTAVYVGKEKRGKGIGTKVLETVKSEADRTGKKIILDATNELDSETDLERLSIFYEKNGFKKVGENKFEYNPQETTAKTETKKTEYKQNLVTPENAREVASRQDTPLKQKIAKTAAMIMRALPGVKIYFHNNEAEMHQALADSTGKSLDDVSKQIGDSRGSHVDGEIHINIENAKETTILHEAFHEAILRSGKSIKTIIDFANSLKNIISDKDVKAKLDKFVAMYGMEADDREEAIELENKKRIADGGVAMNEKESDNYIASLEEPTKSDEFLAELGAIMAEAETELTTTKLQKFLNLINRIARSLGLPVIIKSSATAQEAVDFINSMARSLRTGEAIEEILEPASQILGTPIIKQSKQALIKDFDTTPPKVDGVEMIYPEKSSMDKILEASGGAAVFINSDGTKVGKVFVNGREIIVNGGIDYTYIKKNVDDGIGFAASEDGKISVLKTISEQIIKERDQKNPSSVGKPIAVFVVSQNGETMLGEWYAAEYIMEGIDQSLIKRNYNGGITQAKKDFVNAIESAKIGKTKSGIADRKAKDKVIKMIKEGKFDTHNGRIQIAKDMASKAFSFGFRVNLNKELIASSEKSWNSGKNRNIKKALADSGYTMNDFWNKFLDERFLKDLNSQRLQADKGSSISNKTFSGFFYNPSDSLQDQVNHAKLGIKHEQFNSSFKSAGNFLLDSAYDVNKLFPNMGYPTQEGINEYNSSNNTNFNKKEMSIVDKIKVSTWLNENNKSKLVINPYGSIAMSMYTGYVDKSEQPSKIKQQKTSGVGYRSGDLTNKAETKGKFEGGNRSTGHFGTGFYFFGTKKKADEYSNRETSSIDLNGYNLANGTIELHNLLKDVNKYAIGTQKENDYLKYSIENIIKYFNKLNGLKDISDQNNKIKSIVDKINNSTIDSPSTIVMKSLGFDGVDSRGTDLDNAQYGSVIYSLKTAEEGTPSKIKQQKTQLTTDKEASPGYDAALEALGETEAQRESWRRNNKVNQKQKRNPIVEQAAKDYYNEEINQEEYLDTVAENQPIKPFTTVPSLPTLKDITNSLDINKVAKGILGLTKNLIDGLRVACRLDIPAYENYDTWVVSVHDVIKEGNPIAYGQTAVLKNVEFKTNPTVAIYIASAKTNARGEVTPKSTIARMFGDWVNEDPEAVHARAKELMNDPAWTQVGMNPFRHSWFYDKTDGMPISSAEEVIQVGALVLAKNAKKISPSDPMFETKSSKGGKIKFQKTTQETRMDKESEDVFKKSLDRGTTWPKATQNALDYIQKSKWYQDATDVEREQKVRDFKESKKQKLKKAPSVAKILGTPKPKMVTVNEAAAFKDQIRLEAKAAREAKADLNQKRKSLSDAIKGMVKLGKLKVSQASTIIKRVSQVNLDNPVMVERLIDYAAKVFERADYQERLDRAFSYRRAIKKLLKTDNQAQVVGMANEFTKLDPSMVENIDEYIDIAEKVKNAVAPSKAKPFILDKENYFDTDTAKGFDMILKQATNIEAVSKFVKDELEKQEERLQYELLSTNYDLFESGVLSPDMTAKQMKEIVDAIKKDPAYKINSKEKEKYMMAYLLKRFESLAGTVSDIIKTNQNPVTGEQIAIDQKDVAIISDLLKVDLSEMGIRDALFIVEAMDNFINNGITSKLEAALSAYKGQMGLKKEIKSGKVARPLKLYFIKKAGRALAIEFTPLPLMIERMFTGVRSGISVMDSMGLNIVINGVNKANYLHNKIIDEYYNKFIRKSKTFHKPENVYERGMLSFLKRNVTGSLQEMKSETNRRVRMIEQSINTLMNKGNESQKVMAEIYQKVFDKLGVSTGDIDVIESRASKENRDAVNWWMKEWSKHYKDLADISLSVYNYDLGSDVNYSSPDKYKLIKTEEFDQKLIERNSSFLISMDNYTDKEKTGVLMKSTKPDAMEEGRYVSLDFDANNSNSLKGALVDINTAAGIRQVDGFLSSKLLDKLIPSTEDRDALVMRVNRYIRRSKGKVFAPKDLYKDADDVLSFAARLGVGKALGGVLQSVKQTAPISLSTALMTGKFNIPSVSFNKWLNNTGMGTANRGLDSLSAIESIDRRLEAKGTIIKDSVKTFQKIQQLYLEIFLSKPDVMIARMAFQSYYLQYMGKSSIDWDNHTPNQDALNYAEAMVGRQQNINDPMLGGEFLTSEESMKRISKKILFPFASFGLNQKARLNSDLINMGAKTTSFEDRKIALKSASATIAEMVAYRAIMVGISYEFYKVANDIINYFLGDDDDDDDDKERDKKWLLSAAKFPIKSMINDLVSPLPLLDEYVTMGADYILSLNTGYTEAELDELVKQENEIRGLKDLDPLEGRQLKKFREEKKEESLYQLAGKYESSKFGMGSIYYDAAKKFYNEYQLAMTGEFKDEYRGNITTKKIRPVEQEVIKNSLIFSSLFMLGLLPKEADQITTKVVNMIKMNAMSEPQYEKYEGFKKVYKREPGHLEMALIRSDKKQDYIEKELNFIKDEGGLNLVQAKEYVKIFNLINEVTPYDLSKIKEGQTADQIIKSLKKEYKERISEVQTETEGDGREVFQPIETKEEAEEVFQPIETKEETEGVFQPIETEEETEGVFQPIETEEENSEVFQPIK